MRLLPRRRTPMVPTVLGNPLDDKGAGAASAPGTPTSGRGAVLSGPGSPRRYRVVALATPVEAVAQSVETAPEQTEMVPLRSSVGKLCSLVEAVVVEATVLGKRTSHYISLA